MNGNHLQLAGFAVLAFLFFVVVLAVAVWFAFGSGKAGKTRVDNVGGCAIGCALLFLGVIGGIAALVVTAVAVHHGRLGRIRITTSNDDEWTAPAPQSAPAPIPWHDDVEPIPSERPRTDRAPATGTHSKLSIELADDRDSAPVLRWLRGRTGHELALTVSAVTYGATRRTVVDVEMPKDGDAALEELRDAFQRATDGLGLSAPPRVEIHAAR